MNRACVAVFVALGCGSSEPKPAEPVACAPLSAHESQHDQRGLLALSRRSMQSVAIESSAIGADPEWLFDDDDSTVWRAREPGEVTLRIDLGRPRALGGLYLSSEDGGGLGELTVYGSMEPSCGAPTALASVVHDGGVHLVEHSLRVARFVTIVANGRAQGAASLAELAVLVDAGTSHRPLEKALAGGRYDSEVVGEFPRGTRFSLMTGPATLAVTETGSLSWAPTPDEVGDHAIEIWAHSRGTSMALSFDIEVLATEVVASEEIDAELGGEIRVDDLQSEFDGLVVTIGPRALSETQRVSAVRVEGNFTEDWPGLDRSGRRFAVLTETTESIEVAVSLPTDPVEVGTRRLFVAYADVGSDAPGPGRSQVLGDLDDVGNAVVLMNNYTSIPIQEATQPVHVQRRDGIEVVWLLEGAETASTAAPLTQLILNATTDTRQTINGLGCSAPDLRVYVVNFNTAVRTLGFSYQFEEGLLFSDWHHYFVLGKNKMGNLSQGLTSSARSLIAHEYFHNVQFEYVIQSSGSRYDGLLGHHTLVEGMATFAEDEINDSGNEYRAWYGTTVNQGEHQLDPVFTSAQNFHYRSALFYKHLKQTEGFDLRRACEFWSQVQNNVEGLTELDAFLGGKLNERYLTFAADVQLTKSNAFTDEIEQITTPPVPLLDLTNVPSHRESRFVSGSFARLIRLPSDRPDLQVEVVSTGSSPFRLAIWDERNPLEPPALELDDMTTSGTVGQPGEYLWLTVIRSDQGAYNFGNLIDITFVLGETTTVEGVVEDVIGPSEDRRVRVALQSDGTVEWFATTEADGTFRVEDVWAERGDLLVQAECAGYHAENVVSPVAGGVTNAGTLMLNTECDRPFSCASLGVDWVPCPDSGQCAHKDWFCDGIGGELHCPDDLDETTNWDGSACPMNP